MDYRRTLISCASAVLLLYSLNASASLFSAFEIVLKKASAFFSTGKKPKTLALTITLPKSKLPLPPSYDPTLEPVVHTYYIAVKQLGNPIEKTDIALAQSLRIIREGMSVWLPDGIGSLTTKQREFLINRATYGTPPSRFLSSVFGEKYHLYVNLLTTSADYMIPARLFKTKVAKPLTSFSDPHMAKVCQRHDIRKLLDQQEREIEKQLKGDYDYLPLVERALQIQLKAMLKQIASQLRKQFQVEELWNLYEDIRNPFSPIKLIEKEGNPVVEFPSVCGESIRVTFYPKTVSTPRVKMLINTDGSAILTPRLNQMSLKL